MKVTISSYEGQPEYCAMSVDMPDDVQIGEFVNKMEHLVQGFFPGITLAIERRK